MKNPQFETGIFGRVDFARVQGQAQIEDGVGGHNKNALFVRAVESDRGKIGLRAQGRKFPSLAPIFAEGEIGTILFGLLVVAAGNDAMGSVGESDGEYSSGAGPVNDRGFGRLPALSAVDGVEDTGGTASAGKPDVVAFKRNTTVAGRECAFPFEGSRERGRGKPLPTVSVVGGEELEFQFAGSIRDRVA